MKVKLIAIFVFFICSYLIVGCILYNNRSQLIRNDLNERFFQATISELNQRLKKYNIPFFWGMETEIANDNITIEQEDQNITLSKTDEYIEKDEEAKKRDGLQSALYLMNHPLQTEILDSIFQYHSNQIYPEIKTAIRYEHTPTSLIQDSKPDSDIYNKFQTDTVHLGIDSGMYVRGFYTLPFSQVIKSSKSTYLLFALGWFVLFAFSAYLVYFRDKKIKASYVFVKEAEVKEIELIALTHDYFYDPVKQEIRHHFETIISLRGLSKKIFPAFLNAQEYYLSNEEIDQIAWGRPVVNNTRLQAIKRLRENLSSIPEFQIKNYTDAGYQLQITKK